LGQVKLEGGRGTPRREKRAPEGAGANGLKNNRKERRGTGNLRTAANRPNRGNPQEKKNDLNGGAHALKKKEWHVVPFSMLLSPVGGKAEQAGGSSQESTGRPRKTDQKLKKSQVRRASSSNR